MDFVQEGMNENVVTFEDEKRLYFYFYVVGRDKRCCPETNKALLSKRKNNLHHKDGQVRRFLPGDVQ
jgi:hypothetical protein